MRRNIGTVYLLHFDRPYWHARHYIGWSRDLDSRLAEHLSGHGARLLEVIQEAGIGWTLARTWPGSRQRERQIKNNGGASRCCPQCGVQPRHNTTWNASGLNRIARRMFGLVDADWIASTSTFAYARKRIVRAMAQPTHAITPADVLGWTERTTTMATITYTRPYVRADNSVWSVQEDTESGTENECRMVVDIESGLSIFLPDYVVNVDAPRPASRTTGDVWPCFRWATSADLHTA